MFILGLDYDDEIDNYEYDYDDEDDDSDDDIIEKKLKKEFYVMDFDYRLFLRICKLFL